MTTNEEYDVDGLFEEEEQLLKEESDKVEELYKETKEHFDQVKNIKHKKKNYNIGADNSEATLNKKALPFIANQTANLNTIRKMKIDSINDRIRMKKEKLNLKLKIKQLGVDETKNANFSEIANGIVELVAGKRAEATANATVLVNVEDVDFEKRILELEEGSKKRTISNLDPCVIEHVDGTFTCAFYELLGDDIAINYDMEEEVLKLEIKYDEASGEYFDIDGRSIDIFDE